MTMQTNVTVRPVDEVPWADVRTVFGTRGDPAGCWCQFFKLSNAEWKSSTPDDRSGMLCEQVASVAPAPGVIAYADDEPVGWCAVEPRPRYRRLGRMKVAAGSTEDPDDASVWAVTCFVVRVGFRKRGIGGALLDGAIGHARRHGARVVEGYPVDVGARGKVSSADLYHGPLSLFTGAGFMVAARPTPDRAVVRLVLEP